MALKKWTIARRGVQLAVIGLIAAPLFGLTCFQGNLSAASLAEGANVTVSSPFGKVTLTACADERVEPGTAWVPYNLPGLPAETLGAGRAEGVTVAITAA